MPWNPSQYLAFGKERLRPAVDLLNRIELETPVAVLDLGCGAGNVTKLLAERWPAAAITGVDKSPEMLAKAQAALPAAAWVEADLRTWAPVAPVDLVFSNAALHWLEDHPAQFRRLASWVKPGGVLAVQMPGSFDHPSHTAAFETAAQEPWVELLGGLRLSAHVHSLPEYHAWMEPLAGSLDLWETTYLHALEGEDPVTEWFKGSLLVPYLGALPESQREAFLEAYRQKVRTAYLRDARGRTLMPFRRVFLVISI